MLIFTGNIRDNNGTVGLTFYREGTNLAGPNWGLCLDQISSQHSCCISFMDIDTSVGNVTYYVKYKATDTNTWISFGGNSWRSFLAFEL